MFDIVIPLGPNEYSIIEKQIEYTKANIIGFRNIYIVSSDPTIMVDGCVIIPETIFPFTISDINNIFNTDYRNGWYLQQLLKLYAGKCIPDILDKYLVIDSDTFFIKPTYFIENDLCLYNYGTEYHIPYFEHMNRLHNSLMRMDNAKSGISHHMMFETKYIDELFQLIEQTHNMPFWQCFLLQVKQPIPESGASEYEIYFNYMLRNHPDKINIRKLEWDNNVSNIDNINIYVDDNNYISYHFYRR